jgi:hypothetical protein
MAALAVTFPEMESRLQHTESFHRFDFIFRSRELDIARECELETCAPVHAHAHRAQQRVC